MEFRVFVYLEVYTYVNIYVYIGVNLQISKHTVSPPDPYI